MEKCCQCDKTIKLYNESVMNCQRLMEKLKEYQNDNDQLQKFINVSTTHQMNLQALLESNLKQLLADFEHIIVAKPLDTNNNAANDKMLMADFIHKVIENVKNVYKILSIKDFDQYEQCLNESMAQLMVKLDAMNINPTTTTTTPTTKETASLSKINLTISNDVNEFKLKTTSVMDKLNQQKKMLQTLLNGLPPMRQPMMGGGGGDKSAASPFTSVTGLSTTSTTSSEEADTSSAASSSSASAATTTTTTQPVSKLVTVGGHHVALPANLKQPQPKLSILRDSLSQLAAGGCEHTATQVLDTYICPKCQISIETSKITLKKYENHVRKCDTASKQVCMFCLKLFDKSEQALYENHVQKHLIKESLAKSPITTVSSFNFNTSNSTHSNSSGHSGSKRTSISRQVTGGGGESSSNASSILNDSSSSSSSSKLDQTSSSAASNCNLYIEASSCTNDVLPRSQ